MLEFGEFACTAIQQIVLQGRVALQQAVKAAKAEKTDPKVSTPALLVTKDTACDHRHERCLRAGRLSAWSMIGITGNRCRARITLWHTKSERQSTRSRLSL